MTKDELWKIFLAQTPDLLSTERHITPKGIRKMFDLTWDTAYEASRVDHAPQADLGVLEDLFREAYNGSEK